MNEDLEKFGFSIEKALSQYLNIDEESAKEISKKLDLGDYINLANALDDDNSNATEEILLKYSKFIDPIVNQSEQTKAVAAESVSKLNKAQLQEAIAYLKGYNTPGWFEYVQEEHELRKNILRLFEAKGKGGNFVAKYMNKFNKPSVEKDKKKEAKLGKEKHKKNLKHLDDVSEATVNAKPGELNQIMKDLRNPNQVVQLGTELVKPVAVKVIKPGSNVKGAVAVKGKNNKISIVDPSELKTGKDVQRQSAGTNI